MSFFSAFESEPEMWSEWRSALFLLLGVVPPVDFFGVSICFWYSDSFCPSLWCFGRLYFFLFVWCRLLILFWFRFGTFVLWGDFTLWPFSSLCFFGVAFSWCCSSFEASLSWISSFWTSFLASSFVLFSVSFIQ